MAHASAVSVSSITAVGSVVTVTTATAHGLVANQGFSLTGVVPTSFNVNSTIISAPSSTTFTFNLASPGTYTSGGSVRPAKQIIFLSTTVPSAGLVTVSYLLWLTTIAPVAKSATSQWSGVSAQEAAALSAGTTLEISKSVTFSTATTAAAVESALNADFTAQQAALAGSIQPGTYFGVYYDGPTGGWGV